MTWFVSAPIVDWSANKEKKRETLLKKLLSDNPVWNGTVNRPIGDKMKILGEIVNRCKSRLRQYSQVPDSQTNSELHRIIVNEITLILIGAHIREMLKSDCEGSPPEEGDAGVVHYPPHYFVARFRADDTLEFFGERDRENLYIEERTAEFYDEFQELEAEKRRVGAKVKYPRPVAVIENRDYPELKAVPCTSTTYNTPFEVEIEIIPPHADNRKSYAVANFRFKATPVMLRGKEVRKLKEGHLKRILNVLDR